VAALLADPDHLTIDVFGLVGIDVAGATTAVRDFGCRHLRIYAG
jgi:hypothetical protein